MAHFAKVVNGIVTEVIVASQETIDSGLFGDPAQWLQTSYNTRGGIYYIPNTYPAVADPDQSKAYRKNYAGIGFTYDPVKDAFINQKPDVPPDMEQYLYFDEFACLWIYNPPLPPYNP